MSYTNTALLLPFNGVNGGTSFPDYSRHNRTVTAFGNAQTSTAQSKFYGSSLLLDGSGDYLDITNRSVIGTADFTVELYVRLASSLANNDNIADFRAAATATPFNIAAFESSGLRIGCYWGSNTPMWGIAPLDTFFHLAIVRASGLLTCWFDGVQQSLHSGDAARSDDLTSSILRIGASAGAASIFLDGRINDFRLTIGEALYTANFTPPAKLIAPVAGTITDDVGAAVERRIWVIPRAAESRVFTGLSDSGDGTYSIDAPNQECARIVLDDAGGTQYNDLIDRVAVSV